MKIPKKLLSISAFVCATALATMSNASISYSVLNNVWVRQGGSCYNISDVCTTLPTGIACSVSFGPFYSSKMDCLFGGAQVMAFFRVD